jgi:hypothetical protein
MMSISGSNLFAAHTDTPCLREKASFKELFDKVMLMLPKTYAFGKGSFSAVSVCTINAAIDTFSDDRCTGQFPTLTSDQVRNRCFTESVTSAQGMDKEAEVTGCRCEGG